MVTIPLTCYYYHYYYMYKRKRNASISVLHTTVKYVVAVVAVLVAAVLFVCVPGTTVTKNKKKWNHTIFWPYAVAQLLVNT